MAALKYLINNKEDFDTVVDYLEQADFFAYDTETNGSFSRFGVSLVGISFGFDLFAVYIPLNHIEGEQVPLQYALEKLKPIFENPKKKFVAHNAKFDEMVLGVYDIKVNGIGDDTYVMAWLLSEDSSSKGLKALTQKYLKIRMETYEDVVAKGPKKRGIDRDFNFARVTLTDACSYAADDAYYTYQLHELFLKRLEKQKIVKAYEHIERPFTRILRDIENVGVTIDKPYVERADSELPEVIEQVEHDIYEEAGEVFKIGSGPQLGRILFEKLGIGTNVPKTKSGQFATDKKTLETYKDTHGIVANILRRKKIQKTHSTFVEGIYKSIEKDGRVHPSFNGCGTATGRLSCRSPNLQQIEGDEVESIKIRDFFIPAPGYTFVVGDYSQIELRVMAHFAKDQNMIDAFLSGRDFHEETARQMMGIKGPVDRKNRVIAKTLNFGIGYGRGPTSVSEQLGCSMKTAQGYIATYFENFSAVKDYKDDLFILAAKQGFIRTISGRKRRLLPDIRSNDWRLRSRAERQAFSTKIQGSAADIIKVAMISLAPELEKIGSRMVIQIHDELVIEAPIDKAQETVEVTKQVMENPFNGKNPLILPLITEPTIVSKWGDAK